MSGGGTLDIAVVSINSNGMYHVRSTNGNTKLGGSKFVDALMEFCVRKLNDKMYDTEFSKEEMSVLRTTCEKAKEELSIQSETEIIVSDQKIPISSGEYNEIIRPFVDQSIECVNMAIQDADLEIDDINEVVLVGGSTYTPMIRATLQMFFGKPVNTAICPMEAGKLLNIKSIVKSIYSILTIYSIFSAVAYGACIQAAVLMGKANAPGILVENVIPLSIGIYGRVYGENICAPIIHRNTAYPTQRTIVGRTKSDNQITAKIVLIEGEHKDLKKNIVLGSLVLNGLTSSPKGSETIRINIKIDDKCIITATAIDERTNNQTSINIERPKTFTEEEIGKMAEQLQSIKIRNDVIKGELCNIQLKRANKRIKMELITKIDICPIYGEFRAEDSSVEKVELLD